MTGSDSELDQSHRAATQTLGQQQGPPDYSRLQMTTEDSHTSIRSPGASEGATGPREAWASEAHPLVSMALCSEMTSPPRPTPGPGCPSDTCLAHLLGPRSVPGPVPGASCGVAGEQAGLTCDFPEVP